MLSSIRHKDLKPVLAVLSCLMMVSAFMMSGMVTVEASNPHQGTLTLHLVFDSINYDGYHAIANSIIEELAKIGITVILDYRESGVLADTIGPDGSHWNYTWDDTPNLGWDMAFGEFRGMPTDLLWFPEMYSVAGKCPDGRQNMGYNNTKADELLWRAIHELDPAKRRQHMLSYQEELVHDPPVIQLYAPILIEITDARFQTTWGAPAWDPVIKFSDIHLYTWVEDPMPSHVVLRWGGSTDLYTFNPMFMWTYAQEITQAGVTHNMLYHLSKIPEMPMGEGYITKPFLATDHPIWSPDGLTADLSLRNDVYWHNITDVYTDPFNPVEYNNEKFTADDVILTFEALMDRDTGAWGRRDFVDVLDTSVHPGGVEKVSDYHVRFHLLEPYAPFETLMANSWGAIIVPEHILGSVPYGDYYHHWTNTVHPPPGTGPFRFVEHNVAEGYWKVEVNPAYPEGLGGQHIFDEILFYVMDPLDVWTALMNHQIHFGVWERPDIIIDPPEFDPTLVVYDVPIPATRFLALNLRHPVLSNRYVRQAIAHAINYPHIVDDILPIWGLKGHLQAGPVWRTMEWAYYDTLPPYEYNITLAQQYMAMWNYSLSANAPAGSPEAELGPLGDSDFSGYVELDDFAVWAENVGTAPDAWPWFSGQDVDPDFDNTEYVELADFYDWRENIGEHYPFDGAR